jgi:hypothetical protein
MQLQPHRPDAGALIETLRRPSALAVGATALGALLAGSLAIGRALAKRSQAPIKGDPNLSRALVRPDPGLRRVTVSMSIVEEWISPSSEG